MNRALFARNALACETAKGPACRCACGGALHGSAHSAEWIDSTWRELEAQRLESIAPALKCAHDVPLGVVCPICGATIPQRWPAGSIDVNESFARGFLSTIAGQADE
jgi:hypothetical protein